MAELTYIGVAVVDGAERSEATKRPTRYRTRRVLPPIVLTALLALLLALLSVHAMQDATAGRSLAVPAAVSASISPDVAPQISLEQRVEDLRSGTVSPGTADASSVGLICMATVTLAGIAIRLLLASCVDRVRDIQRITLAQVVAHEASWHRRPQLAQLAISRT